ncbi:MAG: sulfatase-like hydrolase/transferase [Phycisphaeraceae bacterium]
MKLNNGVIRVLCLLFVLVSWQVRGADRPNIILIYTDDHGYTDLGAHGIDKHVDTPHLDKLARGGALMTAGYSSAPQCQPSRAGLMAGRVQNEFAFPHNAYDSGEGEGRMPRIYPKGTDMAGQPLLTIADRMKQLGYVTGFSGKWHLGPSSDPKAKHAPYNRGFDYYWTGAMTSGAANLTLDGKSVKHHAKRGLPAGVANRVILQGKYGESFIDLSQSGDKPFFLYLPLYGPHIPLIEKSDPYYKNFPELDYPHYDDWRDDRRRMGLALIKSIDDAVGGVVAKLREHGLEENTLILFTADNGAPTKMGRSGPGLPGGPPGTKGGVWDGSNNVPLRGEKGSLFEGGIRVPMLAYWKGKIVPGTVIDEMVTTLDLTATSLVAGGGEIPDEFDGVDLLPRLLGKADKVQRDEPMVWGFWQTYAVRDGDWKLWRSNTHELLFNVADDPYETKNLAKAEPEVTARLRSVLDEWTKSLPPANGELRDASEVFAWSLLGAPEGTKPDPRYRVPNKDARPAPYPKPIEGLEEADPQSRLAEPDLVTPAMVDAAPAAGKRVRQVAKEYEGTDVYHALYLPTDWKPGKTYPVIVEYTGNKFPPGQGSGEVKDANLGYGLTGGEGYIWVTMPYVQNGGKENAVTWWGDRQATIDYCKTNLPRICEQFGGDKNNLFICGFSRGAIACSYIGLADDEIASFWKGMITHDHFDGQRNWGYPEAERKNALKRLARLKGRPVLVSGVGAEYLKQHAHLADFTYIKPPVGEIFNIPEGPVRHEHTDAWMHRESEARDKARAWLGTKVSTKPNATARNVTSDVPPMNVVFIVADDLGWADTTLYGHTKLYKTPNIERLAKRGMTFNRAYANSPLCSPTRASILTGQCPTRHGSTAPAHHTPSVRLKPDYNKTPASQKATNLKTVTRLDTAWPTLGKQMLAAGYTTAHFGKWHLGKAPYTALEHGFETDIPNWYGPGPAGSYVAPWKFPNFKHNKPGEHIEDRMAQEAVNWLKRRDTAKPFFMNYWQFSVHAPFDAKPELIEQYRQRIDPTSPQRCPTYAAMVHSLDDAVGTLLDAIDAAGVADRTVIIFTSDNGGNMYNIVEGEYPTSNAPLRGGKATIWEGGIRVPCVVVWPGVTKPCSRSDAIIQTSDFYPTLHHALGIDLPEGHPIDGLDMMPALKGDELEQRPVFTFFPHATRVPDWLPPSIAVHQGDWKLIRLFHAGEDGKHDYRLYNLAEDIGETTNVAAKHQVMLKRLDAMIDMHLRETGALVPKPNPDFDPAQYDPSKIGVAVPKNRK